MMRNLLLLSLVMCFVFTSNAQEITKIRDIQYVTGTDLNGNNGDSPMKGKKAIIKGVVTAYKKSTSNQSYILQDADGAWNGIYVYDKVMTTEVKIGDMVQVSGTVTEYNNLTELESIDVTTVISSNQVMPKAVQVSTTLNESLESVFAYTDVVECKEIASNGEWTATQTIEGTEYTFLVSPYYYAHTPVVGNKYKVTGVVYSTKGVYKLQPRFAEDVIAVGTMDKEVQALNVYPNPAKDVLFVTGSDNKQANVYNVFGQLVLSTVVEGGQINISNLASGVYVVAVENAVSKFIVE